MWTTWWAWMAGAFLLAILEMVAPTYILLGFAIGAFFISGLLYFGVLAAVSLPAMLMLFAAISLVAWLVLRQVFGISREKVKTWDKEEDIND